jgi:uncharacterized membrane protein YuzA (DUF378 family)
MWAVDHASMILIIMAGLALGVKGVFGVDLAQKFGSFEHTIYVIVGLSAIWQLVRQRFPI